MVLMTAAVALTQFSLGLFSGVVLDMAFPNKKSDAPKAEGIETLAQVAGAAIVMKGMQLVVVDQLDPARDTSFLFFVGFMHGQPALEGKIRKLVARTKSAVAVSALPVTSKVSAVMSTD